MDTNCEETQEFARRGFPMSRDGRRPVELSPGLSAGTDAGNRGDRVAGAAGTASQGSWAVEATFWRRWEPDQRAPRRKTLGRPISKRKLGLQQASCGSSEPLLNAKEEAR